MARENLKFFLQYLSYFLLVLSIYFYLFVQDANIAMDVTVLQSKSEASVLNLKESYHLNSDKKLELLAMA